MTHTAMHAARAGVIAVAVAAALTACSSSGTSTTATTSATTAAATSASSAAETTSEAPRETASESAGESAAASDDQAVQLIETAKKQALAATSGAFSGTIDMGSQKMVIAMKGTSDGKQSDATVEMGTEGKIRLIVADGAIFLQADEAFSQKNGGGAFPPGKFVKLPASAGAQMSDSFSFKKFLDQSVGAMKTSSISGDVSEDTLEGRDVYVVTTKDDGFGKITIDKETGNFVKLEGAGDSSKGALTFTGWNEPVDVKAPEGAVDLSKMG